MLWLRPVAALCYTFSSSRHTAAFLKLMRYSACLLPVRDAFSTTTVRRGRMGWLERLSLIAFILLALPEAAWAFGPATHIDLGLSVLRYSAILPLAVRSLLKRYPEHFLYGSCAADIIIGKNLAKFVHHCHNWDVGFRMLNDAENARLQSLCWGFLTHLAADVIAHNNFVPLKVVESYKGRMTRHAYWELRFDQAMHESDGVWETLRYIGRSRFPEADTFLREELSRASRLFPFDVSRRIFNSLMLVGRADRWRKMNSNVAERSEWQFEPGELARYNRLALDSVLALLIDGRSSRPTRYDPTGKLVLAQAKRLRRGLKRMMRKGQISDRLSGPGVDLLRSRMQNGTNGVPVMPELAELVDQQVE